MYFELTMPDFEQVAESLMQKAIDYNFREKLKNTDLTTPEACCVNLPTLVDYAKEIGHADFSKEAHRIYNECVEKAFYKEVERYKLKNPQQLEENLPLIENYAKSINYTNFENWKTELINKISNESTKLIVPQRFGNSDSNLHIIIVIIAIIVCLAVASWFYFSNSEAQHIQDTEQTTQDNAYVIQPEVTEETSSTSEEFNSNGELSNVDSFQDASHFDEAPQEKFGLINIAFSQGSNCGSFTGDYNGQVFMLGLGANQIITVSTLDKTENNIIVNDPNNNELPYYEAQDYGQWQTHMKGNHTVLLTPFDKNNSYDTIEFCAY